MDGTKKKSNPSQCRNEYDDSAFYLQYFLYISQCTYPVLTNESLIGDIYLYILFICFAKEIQLYNNL